MRILIVRPGKLLRCPLRLPAGANQMLMAYAMNKTHMTTILGDAIEVGPIPFDLYSLDESDSLVLLCHAGYEITPEQKEMLGRHDRVFYVRSDQQSAFLDYAIERIDKIVGNLNIRSRDKAALISSAGKRIVQRLLDDPRSGEASRLAGGFVTSYVDLILRFPEVRNDLFAIASRGQYLLAHSFNVCTLSLLIGEKTYGKDRRHLWQLGMGGLLHDIGMTTIDKSITDKPAKLTPEEMEAVQEHPLFSYEILKEHVLPNSVLMMARSHHERINGSGYPDGLSAGNIHPYALIAAVADVYDALTSDAVYRRPESHMRALKEIVTHPELYDKGAIESLLRIVLIDEALVQRFKDDAMSSNDQ